MGRRPWFARIVRCAASCAMVACAGRAHAGNVGGWRVFAAAGATPDTARARVSRTPLYDPSRTATFTPGTLVVPWLEERSEGKPGTVRVSLVQPLRSGVITAADDILEADPTSWLDMARLVRIGIAGDSSRGPGTVIAYVTRSDPTRPRIRARRLTGSTTDWDVAVAPPETEPGPLAIASDSRGGAWVGWVDQSTENYDRVRVQHVRDDGMTVLDASGPALGSADVDLPMLAGDGRGGVFACWQSLVAPGRNGFFLQHLTANGERPSGWPSSGRVVATPRCCGVNPRLLEDGCSGGGVYFVWEDWIATNRQGVRAQHIAANGKRVRGWPAAGRIVAVHKRTSTHVVDAAGDGAGGLLVALEEDETGGVLVGRIGADGRPPSGWPASGIVLSSWNTVPWSCRVIGQNGGALMVWSEDTADRATTVLYGMRFLADGTRAPGWAAPGLVLRDTPGSGLCVMLGPGDDGGAILAWIEGPDGGPYDLYAQWVDAAGHVGVRPR